MVDVRLFISYSSQYQKDVDDLAHFLRSRGADIWVDHAKLTPGEPNWQEAVRRGIEQSTHVIYAASPRANESLYVHAELQYAAYYQKPVIPFWLDGEAWIICAPMEMSRAQYIDARGTKRADANERLAGSLGLTDQSFVPVYLQHLGFTGRTTNGVKVIIPPVVTIPAGPFLMGSDKRKDPQADDDELPQHTVTLGEYAIGQYPLTVAEYACAVGQTVNGTRIGEPEFNFPTWQQLLERLDRPVVNVRWEDVLRYVQWMVLVTGQEWRMPTEAEWEKAARGTDGRIYPWGNAWDPDKANTSEKGPRGTTPVGSYPQGASPYGVQDMSGNVWEWCNSAYRPYPYLEEYGRENSHSLNGRVPRGGSYDLEASFARVAYRNGNDRDILDNVGARLALSWDLVPS